MRILQIISRRQYRGAEVFAYQLSSLLIEKGHNVTMVGILPPKSFDFASNINVVDLLEMEKSISFGALKKLSDLIMKYDIELVQSNASITLKYAVLSRLIFRWKAKIIFRNASILSFWIRNRVHLWVNRLLLNQTDRIICISEDSHKDLQDVIKIDPKRMHVISNGVSVTNELIRSGGKNKILLHVGSFTPEKNHIGLLKIFESIDFNNIELWLVGDGPTKAKTEELANQIDGKNRIKFLGVKDDVKEIMSNADILLLPSFVEGMPAVIMEAGVTGLPVVSYDVGSVKDLIPETYKHFIVEKNNINMFIQRVMDLLRNENLRKEYGLELSRLIRSRYSIESVGDQFIELYKEVLRK